MSKRSGPPPYRPRRTKPASKPPAGLASGDAIAAVLVDMQVQLTRIDGRLYRVDDRLDRMDDRFDRIEGCIKQIAADVHVLAIWKERVFGVIVACGAFAAILAFTINII